MHAKQGSGSWGEGGQCGDRPLGPLAQCRLNGQQITPVEVEGETGMGRTGGAGAPGLCKCRGIRGEGVPNVSMATSIPDQAGEWGNAPGCRR